MAKRKPCVINGRGCPHHEGVIHGKEAEELRAGLEELIEADLVSARSVFALLEQTDARDSLAYLERKSGRKKR